MVKPEVEDLMKNNKELETDRSESISFCSFKDKVEKANPEHIDKKDTYVFPRIIPSFKRKRISNIIIISDDENSNANEEDMAGYKVPSWGAKRARSKRVVKVRRSDSKISCDDNVPISTLIIIRRPRIKTDSEDEGDHDLNSTDSLYNGHTSSEYEENNDDLEEVSESSDEDEENIDDLEEGCESSDESMDDSSENDSNHAFGGGDIGDESEHESDNVSSKSITPRKSYSTESREDSLKSIIYISENDSVHANGGGDSGDECEDETDYDVNTSINLYKSISSDDEEDYDDSDEDEDWKDEDDTLGGSIADSSKNDSECSYKRDESSDECEDTSNDLQLNDQRIPRKRVCIRKWDFEGDMLAAFGKDDNLCLRAVCALYRQQTEDEKSSKETRYRNGRGFNQVHAPRGSELAEFLMDGDPAGDLKKTVEDLKQYDKNGIEDCRKFASTYSKQLFQIYQNKEDPYFL